MLNFILTLRSFKDLINILKINIENFNTNDIFQGDLVF